MSRFCGKCGTPNESQPLCPSCGAPREADVPPPAPVEAPVRRPESVFWHYFGVVLCGVIALGAAALCLAAAAYAMIARAFPFGDLEYILYTTGTAFIGAGSAALAEWKIIRRIEPEAEPRFRDRHRLVLRFAVAVSAVLLCLSVGGAAVFARAVRTATAQTGPPDADTPPPAAAPAAPAPLPLIWGVVTNRTTSQPQPGAKVRLLRASGQVSEPIGDTVTDWRGRFEFTADNSLDSVVVEVAYADVFYRRSFTGGPSPDGVAMNVYDSTANPEITGITAHVILLEPSLGGIRVSETLVANNRTMTTYVNTGWGAVRFYLPPGSGTASVQVKDTDGSTSDQQAERTLDPNVMRVLYPLAPGETRFDIAYTLPPANRFEGRLTEIPGQAAAPLRIAVPADIRLSGPTLRALGQEPRTGANLFSVEPPGQSGAYRVAISHAPALRTGARVR